MRIRNSLMKKFAMLIICYAFVSIAVSTVYTYWNQDVSYKKQYMENLQKLSSYLESEMLEDSAAFMDLNIYYKEHKDEILIPMDYDGDYSRYEQAYLTKMVEAYDGRILHKDIEFSDLDDETKNLYCTYVYAKLLSRYEEARDRFAYGYVYYLYPTTDDNMVYMFDFDRFEKEVNGETFIDHGTEAKEDPKLHKNMWKTWETGQETNQFDMSDNEFGTLYVYHRPLFVSGEKVGLIVCEANYYLVKSEIVNAAIKLAVGLLVVMLISTILVLVILKKIMLKPIVRLTDLVGKYADTMEPSMQEEIRNCGQSKDEIGVLSNEFANMIGAIDEHVEQIKRITAEKEKVEAELAVAATIQNSVLPNPKSFMPDNTAFNINASMLAAKEVGGDFYDFFQIDEDHIAMVIADVSGKGVPAALFMMISKILLKSEAGRELSPSKILSLTNDRLCEDNSEDMFVTVWMGILDLNTGVMKCANGGHEFPVIRRGDGPFELIKDKHNLALAVMEGAPYGEYEVTLNKGDAFFVYTDGVPEATNAQEELFSMERIMEALNQNSMLDVEKRLVNVKNHIDSFVKDAPQFDDITMLTIDFYGKNE